MSETDTNASNSIHLEPAPYDPQQLLADPGNRRLPLFLGTGPNDRSLGAFRAIPYAIPHSEQPELLAASGPIGERLPPRCASGAGAAHLETFDDEAAGQAAVIGHADAAVAFAPGNDAHLPPGGLGRAPAHRLTRAQTQSGQTTGVTGGEVLWRDTRSRRASGQVEKGPLSGASWCT